MAYSYYHDMELKLCPHCGGTAELMSNYNHKLNAYFIFVKCSFCGSTGKTIYSAQDPAAIGYKCNAAKRAAFAWNLRYNNE